MNLRDPADHLDDLDPSVDERAPADRRAGLDRRYKDREQTAFDGDEKRCESRRTSLERRRGAGIRREEDRRSAEEGEMSPEQFEFVMAIEAYKRLNGRIFPTWTEILEIISQLGYRKVEARAIELDNVPEAPLQKVA